MVDKVRDAAAGLLLLNGNDASLKLSIGVSIYPDDGETLEALLPHADAAMYRVKARKKQEQKAKGLSDLASPVEVVKVPFKK